MKGWDIGVAGTELGQKTADVGMHMIRAVSYPGYSQLHHCSDGCQVDALLTVCNLLNVSSLLLQIGMIGPAVLCGS